MCSTKLLQKADVFLHNLAPGAVERLGLGAEPLRARHPRLIWCGISGYGPSGPYASKKAYDLLVQCEAGLLSVTGTPETPVKSGIPAADIAAGMYAFTSILAALVRRGRSGEGATIEVTMLEALGEWMGFPAYFTAYGGAAPPRSGPYHATIVPYGPFQAGDGQTVFLSVQNEREFASFCDRVLEKPRAEDRCALLLQPRAVSESRRPARARSTTCSSQLSAERDHRAAGGGRDRECAPQRHEALLGPSAARARADAGRRSARRRVSSTC